jgi:Flp pilus assembly pilin Flp
MVFELRGRTRCTEDGVTSVEYGLLLGLIGSVLLVAGPRLMDALLWLRELILNGMVGG